MRLNPEHLAHARKVADAVLYEGYVLYPYHQAAPKNQARFQFGVLMPPGYAEVDPLEPSASQTECLLEGPDDAQVRVLARFLQLQDRCVQGLSPDNGELEDVGALYVDGTEYTSWTDSCEREQQVTVTVGSLLDADQELEFHIGCGESAEDITGQDGRLAGRVVRRWSAVDGVLRIHAERVAGPYQALRLRLRLENHSTPRVVFAVREEGLRHALIAAHLLVGVPGGHFLSMTDPPEWAAAEVDACENIGTWPVLAGPPDCGDLLLSSPVILYDHPEVAAESAGQLFDSTEIDEILTLRTLALTDAEKRAARATDSRVAEMMDRLDDLPPEMMDRLHGAIRYLREAPAGARLNGSRSGQPGPEPLITDRPTAGGMGPSGSGVSPGCAVSPLDSSVPWWDPGSDPSVSPETDHVLVGGVRVARHSRVVMRPGARRADAQDLFLAAREAIVEAVLHDVDGQVHLAVLPVDDPAADLQRQHGRFLYFAPDEVEPVMSPDTHSSANSPANHREAER